MPDNASPSGDISGVHPIEPASPVDSPANSDDDRDSFETFLDTIHDELQLHRDVGRRKITVILYRGHEFRRDRHAEETKPVQLWVCRHAGKFKCQGKFKLHVKDLQRITVGATVTDYAGHNHKPYSMDSYGLADVSAIPSVKTETDSLPKAQDGDNQTRPSADQPSTSAGVPAAGSSDDPAETVGKSPCNCRSLSRLSLGDISADFGQENMDSRVRSSPTGLRVLQPADSEEPGPTLDLTTVMVDTSQTDTRGFVFHKFVDCPRHSVRRASEDPTQDVDT